MTNLSQEVRDLENRLLELQKQIRYEEAKKIDKNLPPIPFGTKVFIVDTLNKTVKDLTVTCIEKYPRYNWGNDEWNFYKEANRGYSYDVWLLFRTDKDGKIIKMIENGFFTEAEALQYIENLEAAEEKYKAEKPERERLGKIEKAKQILAQAEEAKKLLESETGDVNT